MTGQRKKADDRPAWMRSSKLLIVIKELSKHGNVGKACRKAKCARSWVYDKKATDSDFADTFETARKCGLSVLIDEAQRRAYEGVKEPKTVAGERVDVVKYSDTLLMFLIKQLDPSYREHFQIDHGNAEGRPFMFNFQLHPDVAKQQGAT